MQLEYYGL
jgi:hypothetical protein